MVRKNMLNGMKVVVCSLLISGAVILIGWIFAINDLAFQSVYGVKQAQIEYKIATQRPGYRNSQIGFLTQMVEEYNDPSTSKNQKKTLRITIMQQYNITNQNDIPSDLNSEIQTIKGDL
jgi:hypothetical protein